MQAFEFNAIDYILKPVRKDKLIQAVQKVIDRQTHAFPKENLDALVNNIQLQSKSGIEKIALPTSDGFEFVHVNNIVLLQAESNYTWVHLENKKYLIAKTLKEMSSMIPFPQFFRAHKSHLVNLNHVARYVRGSGGYLVLDNGEQISVSRGQKDALMRVLNV
jgi:two-component system LytT family response regulator